MTHEKNTASFKEVTIKWVSTVVIAILFLACLVHSNLSLIALSMTLNAENDSFDLISRCRVFIMLQIIALVPHIINLIRGVWNGIIRKKRELSNWKIVCKSTVWSVWESAGLCLFIFYIPGLCKTYHVILLMNCVIVFPVVDFCCPQETRGKICSIIQFVFIVVGVVFTTLPFENIDIPSCKVWILPFTIICLSIAWTSLVQKYVLGEPCCDNNQPSSQSTNDTWELTAILSCVKTISTLGFSMLIFFAGGIGMSPFPEKLEKVNLSSYNNAWMSLFNCSREQILYFYTHITSGFFGYFIGYIACTTRSQRLGFCIPLLLATPVSVGILAVKESCRFDLLLPDNEENLDCTVTHTGVTYLIPATLFFVLAKLCALWKMLFKDKLNIMLRENQLFWTPMYNSALLEHWVMLGRRDDLNQSNENARISKLFICTTMYREDKSEMKQLLQSFKSVKDKFTGKEGLTVQYHIYFDDAIKEGQETKHVQQLYDVLEEVFEVSRDPSTKTYYGRLIDGIDDKEKSKGLKIFLKDNSKVKSKKRWSQVMYMKHILKETGQNHQHSYILTTDADVKFNPESVDALLDLMIRDETVGAVCARTHPLGSGLLVWYQVFEYAIGHWLLKVSEHVLGTVLCAPGCFTVYRCSALNDVLDLYATDIEEAEEFLTKNMGEDRWLCTLLVQKGWRIEYCATAKDYTHCPESFDEFFKQRRRWIVSTVANQWLLIKEWSNRKRDRLHVPFLFMVYQIVLLFSTVIGPSSVILVLSGGLKFGKDWSSTVTIPIQIIACICYAIVCLFFPQRIQLMAGRLLCCLYTIFMGIAIVGTVVGISTDINGVSGAEENFISENMKMSSTSVYLIGMAAIFFVTALLHLTEFWAIFYGIIYLLGLPTGYLILMIYSICNITDTSWGTREDSLTISLRELFRSAFNFIRSCKSTRTGDSAHTDDSTLNSISASGDSRQTGNSTETSDSAEAGSCIQTVDSPQTGDSTESCDFEDVPVEIWLQDMPNEAQKFKENGYEKTSFISGMTKGDLKKIGIDEGKLLEKIEQKMNSLTKYEIPMIIPESVESCLQNIGLEEYKDKFEEADIKVLRDLKKLEIYDENKISKTLKIEKSGHVRRLLMAINQQKDRCYGFTVTCGDASDVELKEKLKELRNNWALMFAMINIMWTILISTLADMGKLLEGVFGSNPTGFAVLFVYGSVLVIQFFAMIIHRISTFLHFLGSIPYICGKRYHSSWVFPPGEQNVVV